MNNRMSKLCRETAVAEKYHVQVNLTCRDGDSYIGVHVHAELATPTPEFRQSSLHALHKMSGAQFRMRKLLGIK